MSGGRLTVNFRGSLPARTVTVLVSKVIRAPFMTKRVRIGFQPNTARLVRARVVVGEDSSAVAGVVASQQSLLAGLSQDVSIVADGGEVAFNHEVRILQAGVFLKLYCDNADRVAHAIDAQVEIELMGEG